MEGFHIVGHDDAPSILTCSSSELVEAISAEISVRNCSAFNVAVVGKAGAGKSSLVAALSNNKVESSSTFQVSPQLQKRADKLNRNITYWDTPGYGVFTETEEEYFQRFLNADAFIVVSAITISKLDLFVINKAKEIGKPVFFVHSKVDEDITNYLNRYPNHFNDENLLNNVRKIISSEMRRAGHCDVPQFVLSVRHVEKWDFSIFHQEININFKKMKKMAVLQDVKSLLEERISSTERSLNQEINAVKNARLGCILAKPFSSMKRCENLILEKKILFEKTLGIEYFPNVIQMLVKKNYEFKKLETVRFIPFLEKLPPCFKYNAISDILIELLEDGVECAKLKWYAVAEKCYGENYNALVSLLA